VYQDGGGTVRVILETRQRSKPFLPIEAESIIPRNFLKGTDLTVYEGNKERALSELFWIFVEGTAVSPDKVEVILKGDTSRVKRVGEYMDTGTIRIMGDIGMHCGNFMSGGLIEINGNAEAWLGREMLDGSIICHGNTGHYCASGYRGEKHGMKGGRIEVMGNAGDFCAEYLTGGEVHIRGRCGDMAGVEMKGGTLLIGGDATRPCGNMKGGTCMIFGTVHHMLPTFRKTGTQVLPDRKVTMDVYTGDVANRGKGTLMVATRVLPG
jgi:formylmethanofuran dehydrogenase subunit C